LYESQKAIFLPLGEKKRIQRYKSIADDLPEEQKFGSLREFMSYDEFTVHRERGSFKFLDLYSKLTAEATEIALDVDFSVPCESQNSNCSVPPESQSREMTWTLPQYRAEVEKYVGAGQRLIPMGFLPLGVINMMMEKRVAWRMVL
jgi:hypothetical protein